MNAIVDFNPLSTVQFEQVRAEYEPEFGITWLFMRPSPRPCFNRICMSELLLNQTQIEASHANPQHRPQQPTNYLVLASDIEGVFNLGGDLAIFKEAILKQERSKLLEYARLCIDNVWTFYNMQAPITTIALVKGQAMGGGFESALSAHVLVAEKGALMGLPEVLFNLFPGMGAMSFLARRIGLNAAEKLIRSGKIYTAEELYEMGVVDVLAEAGQGEKALQDWVRKTHKSLNSFQAIQKAKQRVNPLTKQELLDITEIWVDAAMRLTDRNLKVMDRLVRAQNSKVGSQEDLSLSVRAVG
ncbi:crotonase/enoyl-CoA hydratase family protein [Methylobacillus gramineus]|uniref:crotonase/enoyl-CoA hydratase family protein n=1 Tax=Methylobacillus gramineus TaxID=755169 RepID=UPI001CFFA1C1|nr:crotonase/enoyl-CoA hydratase family protein [Methylobacillus gramineus]MCB5185787.1 crotonase/enoyl-CoA hydratase family protein [Methylobacillus gramineus]